MYTEDISRRIAGNFDQAENTARLNGQIEDDGYAAQVLRHELHHAEVYHELLEELEFIDLVHELSSSSDPYQGRFEKEQLIDEYRKNRLDEEADARMAQLRFRYKMIGVELTQAKYEAMRKDVRDGLEDSSWYNAWDRRRIDREYRGQTNVWDWTEELCCNGDEE